MHHHYLDRYAQGDSPVHRLDTRVKLLATLAYTAVVISFDRYALSALAPLAIAPVAMLWFAGVPVRFALRRAVILSPFVLTLCLASPFYDKSPQTLAVGPWTLAVAGGWLTAGDILAKFVLGVVALTALMSTTSFASLLEAMRRLGVPRLLVMQLGMLYRYLFLLMDQAMRLRRARDLRGAGQAPLGRRVAAAGGVIGSLMVRTLERSERVAMAMSLRGFDGRPRSLQALRLRWADGAFVLAAAAYLLFCRAVYPGWVG